MVPLLALLLAAGAFGLGVVLGRSVAPRGTQLNPQLTPQLTTQLTTELATARRDAHEARGMVADLRETIWQHRETAPVLADVLLDDIRRFEETGRRPNPPLE